MVASQMGCVDYMHRLMKRPDIKPHLVNKVNAILDCADLLLQGAREFLTYELCCAQRGLSSGHLAILHDQESSVERLLGSGLDVNFVYGAVSIHHGSCACIRVTETVSGAAVFCVWFYGFMA